MNFQVTTFKPLIALVALCVVAGCASKAALQDEAASLGQLGNGGTASGKSIHALRERLTSTDHGLEIRRWTLPAHSGSASAAIANFVDGLAADPATLERLARNGLRLERVPVERIDSLLESLGDVVVAAKEWHGQAPQWRSLQERPIGTLSKALAIDGHVHRFDRGVIRLNVRAWTVPMEEGPVMHLELVSEHRIPRLQSFRQLLGESPEIGQAFPSITLDLLLDARFGYVLIGEAPTAPKSSLGSSAASASPSSRIGPMDFAGPQAQAPLTIGEWMMQSDLDPNGRTVLVFVPHIPSGFFPQGAIPKSN